MRWYLWLFTDSVSWHELCTTSTGISGTIFLIARLFFARCSQLFLCFIALRLKSKSFNCSGYPVLNIIRSVILGSVWQVGKIAKKLLKKSKSHTKVIFLSILSTFFCMFFHKELKSHSQTLSFFHINILAKKPLKKPLLKWTLIAPCQKN